MIHSPGHGCRRASERLRLAPLFLAVGSGSLALAACPASASASASEGTEFQSGFLRQGPGFSSDAAALALNALAGQQALPPGVYVVEMKINQSYFGRREIEFTAAPDGDGLLPCLSSKLLEELGVRLDSLADPLLLQAACVDLFTLIPGSEIDFDSSKLMLSLSIPQIAMRRSAAGHVDPELWDDGINAAFVNYQVSAEQHSTRNNSRSSSDDLYLTGGINLGAWRLRSNQTMRQDEDGKRKWTSAYTYAQRDLPGLNASLTLGHTFTGGDVFRSVPIEGLLIRSDLQMLPDTQQGYAPVVRGVALSRSKLQVFQNGYPIYSTYVSAGPYVIDDLTTAGNGELEIVLTEADGKVQRFTQSYASINNLLRDNVWQYSSALGRYNGTYQSLDPWLWQGTAARGIGDGTTLYGGLMTSEFYRATNLGVAKDLGVAGALALDVTYSQADLSGAEDNHLQGASYALKYGKAFTTQTNLRFAGYRYSTEGYRDFDEAVRQMDRDKTWRGSRRSRLEASVHQKLGASSSLSFTFSHQDYWGSDYEQRQFQFNFNTRYAGVTYGLYASQSLSDTRSASGTDRQIGLSISMPLDLSSSSNLSFDAQKNGERFNQRASLNGSFDDYRANYRASVSNDESRRRSASFAVGYQAPFGSIGAGYTQGNDFHSTSVNASGAVLLHGGGIELGPYLGETAALVEVPKTPGVGVQNVTGARTNERGYALVPTLRPYRFNQIALDIEQLGPEVEIENGIQQVVPRRGAVVKASFAAKTVNRLILTARIESGQPLPFGAQITDSEGKVLGVAGQAGQILLATSLDPQTLDARWGEQAGQRCSMHITPADMAQAKGYRIQELTCK
ncbi:fimbrial biogenesis outer membrane usher protein [Pseudomonas sp. v388]|uniref:fimbria/pilus outer membrane usher protein n=1 Tax=Pseudomonas sp. v388 TaxID=2479849 RepID=UPI000F798DFC|nr:fimbria/pilus outer membrane usher protein [Pseudomonas sp. v388]RRV07178.1 fimbrial biogenesis outer membrane usher protein [Pseudomonas sp. v388]